VTAVNGQTLVRVDQEPDGRRLAHLRIDQRPRAAGAAYWKTLEAPGMSDPENVLAALVGQIAELTRSVNSTALTLERVAGDVRAVRSTQDASEKARDDHESRIRDLEKSRQPDDMDERIKRLEEVIGSFGERPAQRFHDLERWRWSVPSLAALLGLVGLVVSIWAKATGSG
jgi:hypothetical protein